MSWQDDLLQLEKELAEGRVSAEDYRKRREQLLAMANATGSEPRMPPQGPGGAANVPPIQGSVGPQLSVGQPPQPPPGDTSAATTQFVPRVTGPPTYGERPVWNNGTDDQPLPWTGSDLPPLRHGWQVQGDDTFGPSAGRGSRARNAVLVVTLVVLIAGGGLALWKLVLSGNDAAPPSSSTAPKSQRPPGPVAAVGALVKLPGDSQVESFTPTELAEAGALPKPDLQVLRKVGFARADFTATRVGTTTLDVWGFTTRTAPSTVLEDFVKNDSRFGFIATSTTVAGKYKVYVSRQESNGKAINAYRLYYIADGQVIRVEAFDANRKTARQQFRKLLDKQTELTPAG